MKLKKGEQRRYKASKDMVSRSGNARREGGKKKRERIKEIR